MAHRANLTMQLTEEQKQSLRDIAKSHGFIIGRGKEKDWGSIRGLCEAIADGKLVVVRPNPDNSSSPTK